MRQLLAVVITALSMSTVFADNDLKSDLKSLLEIWSDKNKVPGVILQVTTPKNQIVITNGATTEDGKEPITTNTLFAVGSITKTFISVLILKYEAEGKLSLNDPIGRYLPQYSRWKDITIKQLLNMTSGIVNFTEDLEWKKQLRKHPKDGWTTNQLINMAYTHPNYFEPGTRWYYSNTNYLLLKKIIEKVSGQSFAKALNAEILEPNNLKHTYYSEEKYPAKVRYQMAHGYYNDHDMSTMDPSFVGGMIFMSTADLENWINHLFIKHDILSDKQLSEMLSSIDTNPPSQFPANTKYGLGIFITTDKDAGNVIWYNGVVTGYSSTFLYLPEKKVLIITQANVYRENDKNSDLLSPKKSLLRDVIGKVIS